MKLRNLTAAFTLTAAFAASSHAATLVQYDMNPDTDSSPPPSLVAAGITATDFTGTGGTASNVGPGVSSLSATQIANNVTTPTNLTTPNGVIAPTKSAGTANQRVISFTYGTASSSARYMNLQFFAAQIMNISSLSFDASPGGSTGPRSFRLRYYVGPIGSLDGDQDSGNMVFLSDGTFANGLNPGADNNSDGSNGAFTNFSYNLSGIAAFQNIPTTHTVVFRWNGYVTSNNQSIWYDNITINGSQVPEPASLALLGLGGLALAAHRRCTA